MALQIEHLEAYRGRFRVYVQRLEVNSVVVILGRNGSGKTTLLDAVAGFLKARCRVVACGRDVSQLPPHKRGLAYVQAVPIDPPGRVDKFLRAVARLHSTEDQVGEVVEALGIKHLLGRSGGLSTGQKQLVNLAAALLAKPCAFLMDEPTSHLDWINKKAFNDVVKKLGVATLYVTHDPFEAMYIADTLCVMENGTLQTCMKNNARPEETYRLAESLWHNYRGQKNLKTDMNM
ncbi:MAG: ATP-binding cassette domain-containing protein [Pyrobaculum sp.]